MLLGSMLRLTALKCLIDKEISWFEQYIPPSITTLCHCGRRNYEEIIFIPHGIRQELIRMMYQKSE
jgi:hypothetical protein